MWPQRSWLRGCWVAQGNKRCHLRRCRPRPCPGPIKSNSCTHMHVQGVLRSIERLLPLNSAVLAGHYEADHLCIRQAHFPPSTYASWVIRVPRIMTQGDIAGVGITRRVCLRLDDGTRIGCCASLDPKGDGRAARLDYVDGFSKGLVNQADLIRVSDIAGRLDAQRHAAALPRDKPEV
jgi:hypothetical protein